MRLLFRFLVGAVLIGVVLVGTLLADLMLNGGRGLGILLGRDRLIAACRPPLIAKLRAAGFEPDDILFEKGETVTVTTSQRTFAGPFTFEDGGAQTRVDGLIACVVNDRSVTVEVRTRSTPLRATAIAAPSVTTNS